MFWKRLLTYWIAGHFLQSPIAPVISTNRLSGIEPVMTKSSQHRKSNRSPMTGGVLTSTITNRAIHCSNNFSHHPTKQNTHIENKHDFLLNYWGGFKSPYSLYSLV